jgi:tetratricopeptide (TPR) repeat protein
LSWQTINEQIKKCRKLPLSAERLSCLKKLFDESHDGMVAFALGEELEKQGELREALRYYKEARRLFPLEQYKLKAETAIAQIETKIGKRKEAKEKWLAFPGINLENYSPETTLFVVSCTKTKIWDTNPHAPDYVPALYAYRGKPFLSFLKWVNESNLETKDFKWIILSAKYGYIEPWHPISNYNVTFNDERTGPISDETLYRQVMFQKRWDNISLKNFKIIICLGSETYQEKIRKSFRDLNVQIITSKNLTTNEHIT